MTRATNLFHNERVRQVEEEGHTPDGDVGRARELAQAGACYAWVAAVGLLGTDTAEAYAPTMWPWSEDDWKPTGDPELDLVKAGGLLAAALDTEIAEQLGLPVPKNADHVERRKPAKHKWR